MTAKPSPEAGKAVADALRRLGVRGVLVTAAEQGLITELACQMPECLCPTPLGGRGYFEKKTKDLSDWMPTADHFPKLKMDGGHLTVENVRLAHRLCNRIDYSKLAGRSYDRDLSRVDAARQGAIRRQAMKRARLSVVVWNMNFARARKNWMLLSADGDLACDIALLNEATAPPESLGLHVETEGRTVGRDDISHGGKKRRKWAAAVASRYSLGWPQDVWTLSPRDGDRRSKLTVSRPGSWTAAVVAVPSIGDVTAISLYGLLDERSDASVHRSLSDLTPLLEDKRYSQFLLLGGDLNTLCTAKAGTAHLARDQGVLDRITKGFGLVDLLQKAIREDSPDRGRLLGCQCAFGDDCRHTWTYRSLRNSRAAYQDDYLFASPVLANRLTHCSALAFTPEWPSDHVPIVATFR